MSIGDTVISLFELPGLSTVDIQPSAGIEWEIHNIFVGATCLLSITDGSTSLQIETLGPDSPIEKAKFEITNSVYLQLENTTGSTTLVSYMGVVVKE
ncbi:MAG: hypothetical protein ACTSPB_06255 [Candidatus Thorarchaeota archaeon]